MRISHPTAEIFDILAEHSVLNAILDKPSTSIRAVRFVVNRFLMFMLLLFAY